MASKGTDSIKSMRSRIRTSQSNVPTGKGYKSTEDGNAPHKSCPEYARARDVCLLHEYMTYVDSKAFFKQGCM